MIGICIILLRIEITMQMLCGQTNIPSKQVLLLQHKLIKENGEHRENQRPRQKGSVKRVACIRTVSSSQLPVGHSDARAVYQAPKEISKRRVIWSTAHTEQIEGFSRGSNLYSWAGWATSRRGPATEIVVLLASRFTMFLSTNGLWKDQFDTVNARSNVKHVRRNESDTQSYLYKYRYYTNSWYDFIHK